MPFPGDLQLKVMGRMYLRFVKELEYFPTDVDVHEPVNKFGPFIPTASYWSRDQKHEFEES